LNLLVPEPGLRITL